MQFMQLSARSWLSLVTMLGTGAAIAIAIIGVIRRDRRVIGAGASILILTLIGAVLAYGVILLAALFTGNDFRRTPDQTQPDHAAQLGLFVGVILGLVMAGFRKYPEMGLVFALGALAPLVTEGYLGWYLLPALALAYVVCLVGASRLLSTHDKYWYAWPTVPVGISLLGYVAMATGLSSPWRKCPPLRS